MYNTLYSVHRNDLYNISVATLHKWQITNLSRTLPQLRIHITSKIHGWEILVQRYVQTIHQFSPRSDQFFHQRYEPNCRKMPSLAMLRNPTKIPRSEFRRGRVPEFKQFFLDHRYISRKIFTKIQSLVTCKVANVQKTDKEKDRKTDKCQMKHNHTLAEVIIS